MASLKFKHADKNYIVKGQWDGKTFTAQAFHGKKEASETFCVVKEKVKDGVLATDEALEAAVLDAAKADVINGA